ncbi:MAG: acyl--CoA ligase [Acidobacteriia bacterium]|nr:acyl--CoA ligase [Terriglobia bacterium]
MSAILKSWGRHTIVDLLRETARSSPQRAFLRFAGREISYGEMEQASAEFARVLQAAGAGHGSRVAIAMANRPAFLAAFLGILRCGATAVPLNTSYKADEYLYALDHAGCCVVVTEATFATALAGVCKRTRTPVPLFLASDDAALQFRAQDGSMPAQRSGVAEPQLAPEDIAGIFYTSGTTARPKGVMITHGNLLYSAEVTIRCLSLCSEDVPALAFPLFHANSLFYGVLTAIVLGGTIGLLPGFSVSRYWEQVGEAGATWTPGITGPLMRLLLRQAKSAEEGQHKLRFAVGGTFLSLEEVEEFTARFGVRLFPAWSMTETVSLGTLHPNLRALPIPTTTAIGFPTLGQEIRVVREDGSDVAPGEPGEILYRSPSLFAGYLNDPEATRNAFTAEGWLRTGDLARMDGSGYLSFVDRKKDMIKTRGENVAAAEVERVLNEHPGVLESAVIGVRSEDGLLGERVEAYVVKSNRAEVDAEELRRWTAEKLADFKVPQVIHFVEMLPKTPLGKIQRQELRKTRAPSAAGD